MNHGNNYCETNYSCNCNSVTFEQDNKDHLTIKFNSKTVPVLVQCTLPDFPSVSSLASLPFLPCRHRTTTK